VLLTGSQLITSNLDVNGFVDGANDFKVDTPLVG
jgi:hypothetical protein